jgi:TPR repeat protein
MAEKHDLLILPNRGDSSIVLLESTGILAARGRKDAARLIDRKPSLDDLSTYMAQAEGQYGVLYYAGEKVPRDYMQAASLFRKAADQGHVHAQCALGMMYDAEQGVPEDNTQAMICYRMAAEQGSTEAQFQLGRHYDQGLGISQDYADATAWYGKAGDQGHAKAQHSLGLFLFLANLQRTISRNPHGFGKPQIRVLRRRKRFSVMLTIVAEESRKTTHKRRPGIEKRRIMAA